MVQKEHLDSSQSVKANIKQKNTVALKIRCNFLNHLINMSHPVHLFLDCRN